MQVSIGLASSSCLWNRSHSISRIQTTDTALLGRTKMRVCYNIFDQYGNPTSMRNSYWYKKWVFYFGWVTRWLRPSTHLNGNGPTQKPFSVLLNQYHIHMPQQQSYISVRDWKVWYSFQGIGGAFLGYRADEGIRCIVRGYSCFKRLFENPWWGLIHKKMWFRKIVIWKPAYIIVRT